MNDLERLNAFVDGELPAAESAAVAALARKDPQIAARIADLRALKQGVADLAGPAPQFLLPKRNPQPQPMRMLLPLAASVFVACGAIWALWPADTPPDTIAQTALPQDLSAERQMLARHDFLPAPQPAGRTDERAYHGARGCILTIMEGDTATLAAYQAQHPDQTSHLWQAQGHARLILARNMDGARFAFLAAQLVETWRDPATAPAGPLPNATPCIG